jgi:glyoxylase-like metal-dependent hydrolase (beta-lactamase superfamily II)
MLVVKTMLEELGIIPVRIELPFRLNHVNCFLVEGENGWTMIDTGLHNRNTVNKWEELLKDKKITNLLVTHYHPDHFGYAGGIQLKTGAKVSMTETDNRAGLTVWEEDFINEIRRNYGLAGVPETIAVNMTSNTESFRSVVTPYPKVDHYFVEGERIQIGNFDYEVIFTPGHSDGLVVFYSHEKNVLFSTDHILPRITPNIAYWFHGIEDPLGAYFNSLDKIKRLDVDFVIPSHGDPFHGANTRIEEIMRHHEERLEVTIQCVGSGSSVYEVCKKLFNRDLDFHEMRFAVGETMAHLEHLRHRGELTRELDRGKWIYSR